MSLSLKGKRVALLVTDGFEQVEMTEPKKALEQAGAQADILSVKERDYVMAARVIGAQDRRILFRHIIPNAIFPTLVLASLGIGDVVLSFAALSFLGIGTALGYADWGQVLSFARNWMTSLNTYWYIIVYPGITLVLFVMGWNLLGDALRDVLDPRLRGKV